MIRPTLIRLDKPEYTPKELIDVLIEQIGSRRHSANERGAGGQEGREFAVAITALEDAQMRYARGRHMEQDTFNPSDVDRWAVSGTEPAEWVADRDRVAAAAAQAGGTPSNG